MTEQIKNPGIFGESVQEAKNSMNSAMKILSQHSEVDTDDSVASNIHQNISWAHSHLPDASSKNYSDIGPIEQLEISINNLEEAYSQSQFLTGDSIIDDAFGHIRRAVDYLHNAMQQIEHNRKIDELVSRLSKIFNK